MATRRENRGASYQTTRVGRETTRRSSNQAANGERLADWQKCASSHRDAYTEVAKLVQPSPTRAEP